MITKEQFINYIERIMEYMSIEDEVNSVFRKYKSEFNQFSFCEYEGLVVDILETILKDDGEWISWWLYETECGSKKDLCSITWEGKTWCIETPSVLYDWLMVAYPDFDADNENGNV